MIKPMRRRQICPDCGRPVLIIKGGVFRHHHAGVPEYPGSPFPKVCKGSGQVAPIKDGAA